MSMRKRVTLVLGLRAMLLALLVFGVARPDLPQFHGKGILLRLVVYPLFTSVVPAAWLARGRRDNYPFDVDALLSSGRTTASCGSRTRTRSATSSGGSPAR
jgi:hypothetical protein